MAGPWKETASRAILAKVRAESVEGDKIVLTLSGCHMQRYERDAALVLTFKEFPKAGMQLNKTQANALRALVAKGCLPNTYNEITEEFEGWDGLALPMYKQENEWTDKETGEIVTAVKLYPCSPALYDKAILDWPKMKGSEPKATPRRSRRNANKRGK